MYISRGWVGQQHCGQQTELVTALLPWSVVYTGNTVNSLMFVKDIFGEMHEQSIFTIVKINTHKHNSGT